ncbi:MAG TPA: hypothetical protein PK659_09665 [Methanothrix sp.]|nr:hypothetical protein [Methanothrix sp.]HOL44507.1 hypothetical protein [Methanothrix sp.]
MAESTPNCPADLWSYVDEYPTNDGDTTYIRGVEGSYVAFGLSDPVQLGIGWVHYVRLVAVMRSSSGTYNITPRLGVYIGGNWYLSPEFSIGTSYTAISHYFTKNPATGTEWTWSDVTNLAAGVYNLGYGEVYGRLTQFYVEVCEGNELLLPRGVSENEGVTVYPSGASADNCVNEYPNHDGDNSYVESPLGKHVGFSLTNIGTGSPWRITNVQWVGVVRTSSGSGYTVVVPYLKIGGTRYYASGIAPPSSYAQYTRDWATNPATGADWTWSDIANLVAGAKLGYGEAKGRMTQMYLQLSVLPVGGTQVIIL